MHTPPRLKWEVSVCVGVWVWIENNWGVGLINFEQIQWIKWTCLTPNLWLQWHLCHTDVDGGEWTEVKVGKHGGVCWPLSEKEVFPNVWESMPWEVAFDHHRQERWHLRELWSSQYCCEMIGLAGSRNLERGRQTASQVGVGSAGLSLKAI